MQKYQFNNLLNVKIEFDKIIYKNQLKKKYQLYKKISKNKLNSKNKSNKNLNNLVLL